MGYVGNQQTEGFSQVPAKQDLTGATGTSLTLTHAVASAEGIDLYINNVRQEPTEAYSVVGTAVTLTGSVVATDDIYVVYNSLALQTTVPPDASVSTAKIIDGDVTSAKLDTDIAITGDLTVDTNTLYVDSTNNRVGIGTSSPSANLHIASDAANTPHILLENTVSSGGDPGITFADSVENYGYRIGADDTGNAFVVTYKSGGIDPIHGTDTERMRIDSSGDLLVGATSTSNLGGINPKLIVQNTSDGIAIQEIGNGYVGLTTKASGAHNYYAAYFENSTPAKVGGIYCSTTSTSFQTSSDYRLKENVTATWDATTRLKQLNPVRFNFIADADTTVDGFLAHEVQTVVPEAISGTHDEVDDDGNPVYQGIDQSKLVPLLVKTIQELEARIVALEAS